MTPKVSIIIPVYNAENTLERCIKSIMDQTLYNFEVLLIDDGSIDASAKICDYISQQDMRFKVYHNANFGVASSREFGLRHANGEFIIHVDSDDWVEMDYLESLLMTAENTSADIVVSDYYYNTFNKQDYIKQQPSKLSCDSLFRDFFISSHASLWNKLVRKKVIETSKAHFLNGINYSEDLLFWAQILPNNSFKVAYCPKALYHYDYFSNGNSITRNYTEQTYKQRLSFSKALHLILNGQKYRKELEIIDIQITKEAYCKDYIDDIEARRLFKECSGAILHLNTSVKNKIGYVACILGLYNISRKLFN